MAASVQGCSLPETGAKPKVAQKMPMKFSEIRHEKLAARERMRENW